MNQKPEYLMMLGYISQMTQEDQDKVKDYKEKLKAIIDNDDLAIIAYTILGMELQSE